MGRFMGKTADEDCDPMSWLTGGGAIDNSMFPKETMRKFLVLIREPGYTDFCVNIAGVLLSECREYAIARIEEAYTIHLRRKSTKLRSFIKKVELCADREDDEANSCKL